MNFGDYKTFFFEALNELGVNQSDIREESSEDIACKCPICGDSRYGNKKRLHLYQKGPVINVNCFNGDCAAKNLTPWNFFKLYAPKTFNNFRNFRRSRYLLEISKPKKESKELSFSDFDFSDLEELKESLKQPTKLELFIEEFERGDRKSDLERVKNFLRENPDSVNEFKMLLS